VESLTLSTGNNYNVGPTPALDRSRQLFSQRFVNNEVKEMQNEDESS
jgi:hypothetical protein